jgi:hypothetical protein
METRRKYNSTTTKKKTKGQHQWHPLRKRDAKEAKVTHNGEEGQKKEMSGGKVGKKKMGTEGQVRGGGRIEKKGMKGSKGSEEVKDRRKQITKNKWQRRQVVNKSKRLARDWKKERWGKRKS